MALSAADSQRVIVVGAGLAGLATARALAGASLDVTVLEMSKRVGEPWRERHPQLRLNTHRKVSGLPGLDLPRQAGAFPDRDSVAAYLEQYASGLGTAVEYGIEVERLDQVKGGWQLVTSNGTRAAGQVVIATGHDRVPWMPQWPGADSFEGELLHSAHLGDVTSYRGKRVLVVGAGNSGADVMNHLAQIETEQVWVSVRNGTTVFPKRLLGVPMQRLAPLVSLLPNWAADKLLAVLERVAFGDLRRYGLPQPADGAMSRLANEGTVVAVDDGFVAALKAGRIEVVPLIERFEGSGVILADGRRLEPDAVICATGYRTGLEPMLGHLGVLNDAGFPRQRVRPVAPAMPGLWFVGMWPSIVGYFYETAARSPLIADGIAKVAANMGVASSRS